MITFEQFWQLLYDHGSRNYYKNDTIIAWEALPPDIQQKLYDRISEKIRAGKYVDFNPLEAIHDNLPRKAALPPSMPTNYNGSRDFDRMVATGRLCTAEYNGQVGIYTIEDVTAHHMNLIKRLQP